MENNHEKFLNCLAFLICVLWPVASLITAIVLVLVAFMRSE